MQTSSALHEGVFVDVVVIEGLRSVESELIVSADS